MRDDGYLIGVECHVGGEPNASQEGLVLVPRVEPEVTNGVHGTFVCRQVCISIL
jgi:hypothetical protein